MKDDRMDILRRIYHGGILFVEVWGGDKPTYIKTRRGYHHEVLRDLMRNRARKSRVR